MKTKDVLVVARPDQSLKIYSALQRSDLSFHYITFKVVPAWIKKIVPYSKLVSISDNASYVLWGSFKHLAIRKFKWRFTKKWSDRRILNRKFEFSLTHAQFKVIHIWPENCSLSRKLKDKTSGAFVIADIHMAHPSIIYEEMKPVYLKFGIDPRSTSLYNKIEDQKGYVEDFNNVLVPSSYVAETYKKLFPDKKYFVVPYGISFCKDNIKSRRSSIKDFVYAGAISLEKGCDLLLDYFASHPNLNIHLYGNVLAEQSFIFDKYNNHDNIIFHGHVAKSQLQKALKHYDVGIHLSRFDAYSLAVGEIIGAGLPVIVSDKTGNADDVVRYGFGLVTKLDEKSVNEAIETICSISKYKQYQDNIEAYIQQGAKDYGQMMIEFYHDAICNGAIKYLLE